jgi:hypothetical protein
MHTHRVGRSATPAVSSVAVSIPAGDTLSDRRRFLQILFGASLAAASLAIAGCATTESRYTPPTYQRRGGNRGGDAGASHR